MCVSDADSATTEGRRYLPADIFQGRLSHKLVLFRQEQKTPAEPTSQKRGGSMLDGSLEIQPEILEETLFENSFLRKMRAIVASEYVDHLYSLGIELRRACPVMRRSVFQVDSD
jgi:hypothetical protein